MTVAFDVDSTLIDNGVLKRGTIKKLLDHAAAGDRVIVWSMAGKEHAQEVGKLAKLPKGIIYRDKPLASLGQNTHGVVDLAYDNEAVKFGKKNIRVK